MSLALGILDGGKGRDGVELVCLEPGKFDSLTIPPISLNTWQREL